MIITTHAYARAGMVGNPSDGYYGKTISFIIRNFKATVTLWESPKLEILPATGDVARYDSPTAMLRDIKLFGYYGAQRVIKASIKRFYEYCAQHDLALDERNFTIQFESDIPRLVGLSGSSGIVVATLRALMQFHNVQISLVRLPALTLSAERDELKITAGLQDRVIQNYEGIVYMDFDKSLVEGRGYGEYEPLRPAKMPPLYVAYDPQRAEISDVTHRNLRALFDAGDPQVVGAMRQYRDLTDQGKAALLAGDWEALGRVMNANFDLRRTIMPVAPENLRMVEVARNAGASAKFAGSGGAICGLCEEGTKYQKLCAALEAIGCAVIRPQIFED
jgi:glucuronokinase